MLLFLTQFLSSGATRELQLGLHFCHIKIRFQVKKAVCAAPPDEKMVCLLPGNELCQIEPEMRRFASQSPKYSNSYESKCEWNCFK